MLDENKYLQYGFPRENKVECIVIHNTGNKFSNAREFLIILIKKKK